MISSQKIEEMFGAVGWLIDRATSEHEILGTVWLARSRVAISCAHVLIPYFDLPEALAVDFPLTGQTFGVKEILVHSGYDPWMAKRNYEKSNLHPPLDMANQLNNLAALTLSDSLNKIDRDMHLKLTRALEREKPVSKDQGISGKATRDQIATIVQTLFNAHNTGTLSLWDSKQRAIALFYIKDMKVTHVKYQGLENEDALLKMMTDMDQEYDWFFIQDYEPDWIEFEPIQKNAAMILVDAFRRVDERDKLLAEIEQIGGLGAVVYQARKELDLSGLDPQYQPAAACIWNHIKYGVPVGRLMESCKFDGNVVMVSVKHLVMSKQASIVKPGPPPKTEITKLYPRDMSAVAQGQPILALTIDGNARLPIIEFGYALDPLPEKGNGYYVHSLGLPTSATGCPLIVNDEVVGIHCGPLTTGKEPYLEWLHPGLMISSEAVYQCLDLTPDRVTTEVLAYTPPSVSERLTAGKKASDAALKVLHEEGLNLDTSQDEIEEAVIEASKESDEAMKWSSSRGDSAIEQRRLISAAMAQQEPTLTKFKKRRSGIFGKFKDAVSILGGKSHGVDVSLLRQGLGDERFDRVEDDRRFQPGDCVRLHLTTNMEIYLAVLLLQQGDPTVRIVFPDSESNDGEMFEKGAVLEIPTEFALSGSGRTENYAGIPINSSKGYDELLVCSSVEPLMVSLHSIDIAVAFKSISNALNDANARRSGKFQIRNDKLVPVDISEELGPSIISCDRIRLIHA